MTATGRRRSPPPRSGRTSPTPKIAKRPATKAAAPKTVDEYLARLPADQRAALSKVRRTIRAAAPDAVEYIGYGLAGYKLDGKPLMYFGAMKKHCGLYGIPAEIDEFAKELKGFEASKGAVRFTPEKPLPATLVTRLVRYRVKKIRQR